MAEDKKPKIDLKARLGKTAVGQAPPAVPPGVVPPPPSATSPSGRPASRPAPGIPVPPGVPVGSPLGAPPSNVIDPSNPLSAVANPRTPPPPPPPARIEVDEASLQVAARGARRNGFLGGLVVAVLLGGVGVVLGQSLEKGDARTKSKKDAADLAMEVGKAKDQIKALGDKMDNGRKALHEKKFPAELARELSGVNINFDGTMLAGRRFSGFPTSTTQQLVEFITRVQTLKDKQSLIVGFLNKLQKPLTEQFNAPQGQSTIQHIVIVSKDQNGSFGMLAPLQTPIVVNQQKFEIPKEFNFTDPRNARASKLERYAGGEITADKPSAVYVVPNSFDKACPSDSGVQAAQLAAQMGGFLRDVQGEQADPEGVSEPKPGLLASADKLIDGLKKVE
jgi:hypothetical protein